MLKIKSMDELKGFGTFNLLGNHLENALKMHYKMVQIY